MHRNYNRYFILFFFLVITGLLQAQPQDNSPYSRYGIGNLAPTYFAANGGMGGLTAAYNSPYHLNIGNPASYAFLGYTSFEIGMYYKYTNIQSTNQTINTNTGNLSYVALGFPIYNPINRRTRAIKRPFYWGMSLGLVPYSSVAYDIEQDIVLDSIGNVSQLFRGDGQLYKAYYGTGVRWKGIAVGANIGYLFGNISQSRLVNFEDIEFALLDDLTDDTSHSGFTYDFGVQYQYTFSKLKDEEAERKRRGKKKLTVGVAGNGPLSVRTNSRQIYSRGLSGYGVDTISFAEDLAGTATFPSNVIAGFTISQDLKWQIGADFTYTNWSSFEHPNLVDPLENTYKIAVGAEILPDDRFNRNYLKQIRYRFGAFYGQDPRVIGETQLTTYGGTIGFGLPVRVSPTGAPSYINLTFEGGRLGDSDLIMENYFRMTVGFTLNDNRWFFKRKFL